MDLDSLLQPISEENPVGVDLRENSSATSSYYVLKEARNQARAAERNNVFDASDNTALSYWEKIRTLTPKVVSKETKDLEITSWYIEALVRTRGFEGLLDGFRFLNGLISQYWDDLYPLPDEDGLATKVASITGLNGEGAEGVLITPIRNIPITQASSCENFSLWQYMQAIDVQKISDEKVKADRVAAAGFSMEDIQRAVGDTSDEDFLNFKNTISACLEEYRQISQLLDESCGEHSPPSSKIINVLEDCAAAINHLYKDRAVLTETTDDGNPVDLENGAGDSTAAGGKPRVGSTIRSREEAFQHILEISAYFRQTEPHSPVSYVLEKAVKWGRMPLDKLIPELIADGGALEQYRNLTGIVNGDD